ncbi:MAG TPA: hypothetical protein VGS96_11170 [Thermoanaerobaculia bacterium]|nr:hypothetical protein [Thermoanaerobaculia bacterium]
MARELGMNPKKFGSLANHKQESWKVPLPEFIQQLYEERFGKPHPDKVMRIEERAAEISAKKAARKAERAAKRAASEGSNGG